MSLIPWYVKAGAIALVLVAAFGSGVWVRGSFCDAAEAKAALASEQAVSASLRNQLQTYQMASAEDAERAVEDQQEIARLKKLADELEQRISNGPCLTDKDLAELRRLWGGK